MKLATAPARTWFQATVDPTLPLGAAIAFCAWKLFDKRKRRNPDGPYMGGSPVWGALVTTLAGLVLGGLVRAFVCACACACAGVWGRGGWQKCVGGLLLAVLSNNRVARTP